MDFELLLDSLMAGLLLGGFYAAVSIGLAVVFGLLDVPHIAHPVFVVLGGYGAVILSRHGIDPLIAGPLLAPLFFVLGVGTYRFYHQVFERRGSDAGGRGLAFFFGVAFVVEVLLIIVFGVDQASVEAPYIGKAVSLGEMRLPIRLIVASVGGLCIAGVLALWLSRTFDGRATRAVAQDSVAVALMGADPVRIKTIAFGIATATVAISGALLVIVGPIEPHLSRVYIGKVFAIVVLAGLGSIHGTVIAALILGIAETMVLSSAGASWAPAVAFSLLLVVLAVRPKGLFGR